MVIRLWFEPISDFSVFSPQVYSKDTGPLTVMTEIYNMHGTAK